MANTLKYVPSKELTMFDLELFGVGTELKSSKKTTEKVVSKPFRKEDMKKFQKQQKQQKQQELQEKLRKQHEEDRIAYRKLYGEKYDFKPPAPKPKIVKSKQVKFIRPEVVSMPEISEQRCLIGDNELKYQPRVDNQDEGEFKVIHHPMILSSVDRVTVQNTGHTVLDAKIVVVKNETQISKTAAKKNRSKLSKANFAFDMQGKPINMNTQNMDKSEISTPVLELENSFFTKVSESDSDTPSNAKITKAYGKEDFLLVQDTKKNKRLSKRASKKIAKLQIKMEEQSKVEQPIEPLVLEAKVEEPIEQSIVHQAESVTTESESQTDFTSTESDDIADMRELISSQQSKIEKLNELLMKAIQRIDMLEAKKEKEEKPRKVENQISKPQVQIEQPCTSFSLTQIPIDPVRETAKRREKFTDDGNNLKVNLSKAATVKEQVEVVKNLLTKSEDEIKKAVDQEVRDVSAERVDKLFSERLKDSLVKSEQKFKVTPQIVRIVRDPSRPNGLPAKVWEKIKTSIPETEIDFQKKRDLAVAKKFKITFYARRQILLNKWELTSAKQMNPYLLNQKAIWNTIGVVSAQDTSIFDNINKWADQAASFTFPGVDKLWAKQNA